MVKRYETKQDEVIEYLRKKDKERMEEAKKRRIKPIYIMNEEGLSDLEKSAVLGGVEELLEIAGVDDLINITDLGVWRNNGYHNRDGSLKEYQSVDWYLQEGKCGRKTQLNAYLIWMSLLSEPWKKSQDHYDILVLHSDIFAYETNFVIGIAGESNTVISTYRFRDKTLSNRMRHECIKTETMHELGHVFGLTKSRNIEYSLGPHCANKCIMRQGLEVPRDWITITNDRLRYGPLCDDDKVGLRAYFKG